MTTILSYCFARVEGLTGVVLAMTMLTIALGTAPAWAAKEHKPAMSAAEAKKVLARARPRAEKGYANAQYNLGVMYANGYGVPQSWGKAREWYRKAARQTHAKAAYNLGLIYAKGKAVSVDKAKAAKWFQRAARYGSTVAQSTLAVLYARGEGVDKDIGRAAIWATRAARGGNATARRNLAQIVARLPKRYVAASEVAMRVAPAEKAESKMTLERGTRLARLAARDEWIQVLAVDSQRIGWINADKLSRRAPSTRVAQLRPGGKARSKDANNRSADKPGGQSANDGGRGDAASGAGDQRVVAADSVNIRAEPARDATVKFQADSGTTVTIQDSRYGWKLATFPDGREGWVAGFLLN